MMWGWGRVFEDAKEIVKLISKGRYKRAVELLGKTSIENVPTTFLFLRYFAKELDPIKVMKFFNKLGEAGDEKLLETLRELAAKTAELNRELKSQKNARRRGEIKEGGLPECYGNYSPNDPYCDNCRFKTLCERMLRIEAWG